MLLTDLPNDVIQKIFYYLLNEPVNYLNLASTCKRFCHIATERIVTSLEWSQARSIPFNLNLDLVKYSPELCKIHVHCTELQYRSQNRCELQQWRKKLQQQRRNFLNHNRPNLGRFDSGGSSQANKHFFESINQLNYEEEDGEEGESDAEGTASQDLVSFRRNDKGERECCYYHRLFCLLNAKYVTFSSLKFRQVRLSDRGCIRAFRDSLSLNRSSAELKISALVELELHKCDITLDWLNTILSKMENVKYLALDEVSFIDPTILVEPKDFASKVLQRLRITEDRNCHITDSIFTYFLDNFPAAEFDLSGTRLQYHKRIIQRYYPDTDSFDSCSAQPSECIFAFPIILRYLRRYRSVVRHFIANRTDITFTGLKKILQDDALKHLNITIRDCPMITQFERSRLADQVDETDLARVIF